MKHQFTSEDCSKGGRAIVQKYGREYMAAIGSKGFQAAIISIAGRQELSITHFNPFRNLLRNLKASKGSK